MSKLASLLISLLLLESFLFMPSLAFAESSNGASPDFFDPSSLLSFSSSLSSGGGGGCFAVRNPANKAVGNNLWAPCCNCCKKGGTSGFLLQAFDSTTGLPAGSEIEKIFENPISLNGVPTSASETGISVTNGVLTFGGLSADIAGGILGTAIGVVGSGNSGGFLGGASALESLVSASGLVGEAGSLLGGAGSLVGSIATGGFGLGDVGSGLLSSALSNPQLHNAAASAIGTLAAPFFSSESAFLALTGEALPVGLGEFGSQIVADIIGTQILELGGTFIGPIVSLIQGNVVGGLASLGGALIGGAIGLGPIGAAIGGIFGSVFGSKKCIPVGCLNAVCKSGNAIWDPTTGICGCDQGGGLGVAGLVTGALENLSGAGVTVPEGVFEGFPQGLEIPQGVFDDLPQGLEIQQDIFEGFPSGFEPPPLSPEGISL